MGNKDNSCLFYELTKDNKVFKFEIIREEKKVIIKYENYSLIKKIKFNLKDLLTNEIVNFHDINSYYKHIINSFKKKKVYIKRFREYDSIALHINLSKRKYELILIYQNEPILNLKKTENLINDSYIVKDLYLDNSFSVFKSINNIYYIIYSNKNKDIIIYNIINRQKVNEIKKAHKNI